MRGPTLLLLAALPACFHDPDLEAEAAGSSSASSGSEGDACAPGLEGCPCIDGGLCVAGLACASNLCVDVREETSGGEGAASGTDGSGGDTDTGGEPGSCVDHCGGLGAGSCFCDTACTEMGDCCPDYVDACPTSGCVSNDECGGLEVCSPTLGCTAAYAATYDLIVDDWHDQSGNCWDFDGCAADVFYRVHYGGQQVFESDTVDDVVETAWQQPAALTIDDVQAFSIEFFDEDDFDDNDPIVTSCFAGPGGCGPVPVGVLHAGSYAWDDGGVQVSVRFLAH